MPVIPATPEAEIEVQGQSRQKVSKNPPQQQQKAPGMVIHVYNPSYTGGIGRKRTEVLDQPGWV
jgi:hypothetical protein